jgi:hypothetical protein
MEWVQRVVLSALLAAASTFALPVWGQALANGDSVEIFRGREGLYEIVVGAQPEVPVVGTTHFTITLNDLENSAPVIHAMINIVANDPEGKPTYRVRALNSALALKYYGANITFESPGDWTLMVHIESDRLGRATVAVPLRVGLQAVGPSLAGTIIWAIVLGTLVGGSLYLWYRQRRFVRGI